MDRGFAQDAGSANGPAQMTTSFALGSSSLQHPPSIQSQSSEHRHPSLHIVPSGDSSNSLPCHDGVSVPLLRSHPHAHTHTHPHTDSMTLTHSPQQQSIPPAPSSAVEWAGGDSVRLSFRGESGKSSGAGSLSIEDGVVTLPGEASSRFGRKAGEVPGRSLNSHSHSHSHTHHPHKDSDQSESENSEEERQRQGLLGEGRGAHVSRAYDEVKRRRAELRSRVLNILLVSGDCFFLAMQPILVYLSKVDGKFLFDPVSVNFLTEICKMAFATPIVLFHMAQVRGNTKRGDNSKPASSVGSAFTLRGIWKAAKANTLLAVPAGLYSVNNYLKFVMQLYFKPTTVKMLGNLKILVIALLLKLVMKRKFSTIQWEALLLLLIGISVNQIPCGPSSDSSLLDISPLAWMYTFLSVTIPSAASVFNEYALKSQFDTSVHLQNFFMYCYGVLFNLAFLIVIHLFQGGQVNLLKGHSHATALLIANNALQGILSSFFFKYADAILKKYSSTIATIFTALMSASLFGHTLTINFVLGVSVVIISMHQFFSTALPKQGKPYSSARSYSLGPRLHEPDGHLQRDSSLLEIAAGANEEANHHTPKSGSRLAILPK